MEQPYFIPKNDDNFLNLNKPIVFFDLETTGTSTIHDRIVEIYAVKINVGGSKEELYHLINPGIPIPPGAVAVHGITNEIVAAKLTFGELAETLAVFFKDCDLGGYNIRRFDVPMLMEEFARQKKYPINFNEVKLVDAMSIYHNKEKRDLAAAVKFYCHREHEGAHSAKADVQATIDILKHQLLLYKDLEPNTSFLHDFLSAGNSVDFAGKFIRDEQGRIILNFGLHKGKEACTQPDYLRWMFERGEFAVDSKMVAKKIFLHCKWEEEIKIWLNKCKIVQNSSLASLLWDVVSSEHDVYPFKLKRVDKELSVTYLIEPPSVLKLVNDNMKRILLDILSNNKSSK